MVPDILTLVETVVVAAAALVLPQEPEEQDYQIVFQDLQLQEQVEGAEVITPDQVLLEELEEEEVVQEIHQEMEHLILEEVEEPEVNHHLVEVQEAKELL